MKERKENALTKTKEKPVLKLTQSITVCLFASFFHRLLVYSIYFHVFLLKCVRTMSRLGRYEPFRNPDDSCIASTENNQSYTK